MSQRCAHTFYPWLPVPPPWGNYPCLHLGEWIEVLRRHCDVSQGHKTENWLGYDLNQGSIWPMAHPLSINIHHAFPFCRDSLHQQQFQHILMTLTSKGLHSEGEETKEGSCLPSSKRVTQTSDTHSQSPPFPSQQYSSFSLPVLWEDETQWLWTTFCASCQCACTSTLAGTNYRGCCHHSWSRLPPPFYSSSGEPFTCRAEPGDKF